MLVNGWHILCGTINDDAAFQHSWSSNILFDDKSKQTMLFGFFYELHILAAEYNIHLSPSRIITDFEKTIPSAAREYFPDTDF